MRKFNVTLCSLLLLFGSLSGRATDYISSIETSYSTLLDLTTAIANNDGLTVALRVNGGGYYLKSENGRLVKGPSDISAGSKYLDCLFKIFKTTNGVGATRYYLTDYYGRYIEKRKGIEGTFGMTVTVGSAAYQELQIKKYETPAPSVDSYMFYVYSKWGGDMPSSSFSAYYYLTLSADSAKATWDATPSDKDTKFDAAIEVHHVTVGSNSVTDADGNELQDGKYYRILYNTTTSNDATADNKYYWTWTGQSKGTVTLKQGSGLGFKKNSAWKLSYTDNLINRFSIQTTDGQNVYYPGTATSYDNILCNAMSQQSWLFTPNTNAECVAASGNHYQIKHPTLDVYINQHDRNTTQDVGGVDASGSFNTSVIGSPVCVYTAANDRNGIYSFERLYQTSFSFYDLNSAGVLCTVSMNNTGADMNIFYIPKGTAAPTLSITPSSFTEGKNILYVVNATNLYYGASDFQTALGQLSEDANVKVYQVNSEDWEAYQKALKIYTNNQSNIGKIGYCNSTYMTALQAQLEAYRNNPTDAANNAALKASNAASTSAVVLPTSGKQYWIYAGSCDVPGTGHTVIGTSNYYLSDNLYNGYYDVTNTAVRELTTVTDELPYTFMVTSKSASTISLKDMNNKYVNGMKPSDTEAALTLVPSGDGSFYITQNGTDYYLAYGHNNDDSYLNALPNTDEDKGDAFKWYFVEVPELTVTYHCNENHYGASLGDKVVTAPLGRTYQIVPPKVFNYTPTLSKYGTLPMTQSEVLDIYYNSDGTSYYNFSSSAAVTNMLSGSLDANKNLTVGVNSDLDYNYIWKVTPESTLGTYTFENVGTGKKQETVYVTNNQMGDFFELMVKVESDYMYFLSPAGQTTGSVYLSTTDDDSRNKWYAVKRVEMEQQIGAIGGLAQGDERYMSYFNQTDNSYAVPAGVSVYYVSDYSASTLTLKKCSVIPAQAPVVIAGSASTTNYQFFTTQKATSNPSDNKLVGNAADYDFSLAANQGGYALLYESTGTTPKYYRMTGGVLPAGRSYLPKLSSGSKELAITFADGGQPDGIAPVEIQPNKAREQSYDLLGRPTESAKGLYIRNGRIYLKK